MKIPRACPQTMTTWQWHVSSNTPNKCMWMQWIISTSTKIIHEHRNISFRHQIPANFLCIKFRLHTNCSPKFHWNTKADYNLSTLSALTSIIKLATFLYLIFKKLISHLLYRADAVVVCCCSLLCTTWKRITTTVMSFDLLSAVGGVGYEQSVFVNGTFARRTGQYPLPAPQLQTAK